MDWYKKLSSSEKNLIKYGSIVVGIALFWVLVFKPITQSIKTNQQQLALLSSQYKEMQKAKTVLKSQVQSGQQSQRDMNKPFISWIDEQLEQKQLAQFVTRSEPKDSQTLILSFENVAFDDLAMWLQTLEQKHQIKISEADVNLIDRDNGLCNARLTLEEK